ncbi:MAG TPA: hypothetical protein VH744_03420 [Terriglobales bacterium]
MTNIPDHGLPLGFRASIEYFTDPDARGSEQSRDRLGSGCANIYDALFNTRLSMKVRESSSEWKQTDGGWIGRAGTIANTST